MAGQLQDNLKRFVLNLKVDIIDRLAVPKRRRPTAFSGVHP
ncbi:MAG: hypothetical protein O7G88_00130 [bacterium]|nr:hypothetical protein [bacterium]